MPVRLRQSRLPLTGRARPAPLPDGNPSTCHSSPSADAASIRAAAMARIVLRMAGCGPPNLAATPTAVLPSHHTRADGGKSGCSLQTWRCIKIQVRPLARWAITRALARRSPPDNRAPTRLIDRHPDRHGGCLAARRAGRCGATARSWTQAGRRAGAAHGPRGCRGWVSIASPPRVDAAGWMCKRRDTVSA